MEYTKIILKLVNDMLKLEEKHSQLEKKVEELEDSISTFIKTEETESSTPAKLFSKDQTISLITLKGLKEDIDVHKASMNEGGGVITKYKDHISKKVMLKSSRNYSQKDKQLTFRAWHTLPVESLEMYDGYIFTVENGEDIELFIFTQQELKSYVMNKTPTKSNGNEIYHFYFSKENNGKYVDRRGDEKSITKYHNNWNALKTI